jgi:putative ABC transport system permease protein
MTPLWYLTRKSIANRGLTVFLTVLSVSLAVAMLVGVERLRSDAREGFSQTISGTDLLVGARSGPVQLLLYSVFHIGDATNNISWDSIEEIKENRFVDWVVPITLGDTHRGFRVVGTTTDYFEYYKYGRGHSLEFAEGRAFDDVFDAVVGAEVADRFDYELGQDIVVSHGGGEVSFADHDDMPFQISGILERTGTPVDRTVMISLEAWEAIHLGWQGGVPMQGVDIPAEKVHRFDLSPDEVTAAMVGLTSRAAVFRVQRDINNYAGEPLLAILPGATLHELWGVIGIVERALLAVSGIVVLVGLAGLIAVVTASLGERRRELAILRAMGASPRQIFALLALESLLISVLGCLAGLAIVQGAAMVVGPWLEAHHGLLFMARWPSATEWALLGGVMGAAFVASLVPGFRAYRYSLADGMTIRI